MIKMEGVTRLIWREREGGGLGTGRYEGGDKTKTR